MILCHCRAVSDRVVRTAVATGACDLQEVAERCGAGARCGGCHPALMSLLAGLLDTAPDDLSAARA
ncbi:MAG: BFD-like [2Fe-2S] binding domain [Acidimicrobiales bacterium]|nr:BFD-like [2Fe-2S] binding domain [Acidimicrobiales bacterium]